MIRDIPAEFFEIWNSIGFNAALGIIGLGVLLFLVHHLRLLVGKNYKSLYDYVSEYEVKILSACAILVIIGLVVYANTWWSHGTWFWFAIRVFVTSMMGVFMGVVLLNLLKFYYPFTVERRLKRLRTIPRTSPQGRKMRLLSEDEEDPYLDMGMQAEEEAFTVDYDVWIDEESGETKIEKYSGKFRALKCGECGYQTLKPVKEDIVEDDSGRHFFQYFTCTYCGHKVRKSRDLPEASPDNKG